jgi:hypothetical protein
LKKCIPTTFSGRSADEASELTRIDDVLVARMVPSPQISDSRSNSSRFSSIRSGAASITSSASLSPSSDSTVCSRSPAAAASSADQRPRAAPLSSPSRILSAPFSSASGSGSCSSVSIPARQPSCAIPAPMVPAPTTPRGVGRSVIGYGTSRAAAY